MKERIWERSLKIHCFRINHMANWMKVTLWWVLTTGYFLKIGPNLFSFQNENISSASAWYCCNCTCTYIGSDPGPLRRAIGSQPLRWGANPILCQNSQLQKSPIKLQIFGVYVGYPDLFCVDQPLICHRLKHNCNGFKRSIGGGGVTWNLYSPLWLPSLLDLFLQGQRSWLLSPLDPLLHTHTNTHIHIHTHTQEKLCWTQQAIYNMPFL